MTDLISRQAAIDALERLKKDISGDYTNLDPLVMAGTGYIGDCIGELQDLPSAQPEQPSREYVEQLKWERDLAIQQLKDLGYGLGENPRTQPEIVRCFDCKNSPLKTWFNCPLAHLPFDGGRWCWKGERDDSISD